MPRSEQHEHRSWCAQPCGSYGWAQVGANEEAVLAERLATTGLDPKKAGERVVDAIRRKTFYAFVSAVPADTIKAHHWRIEDALNSVWVTHY
jgi:hypothetical protein